MYAPILFSDHETARHSGNSFVYPMVNPSPEVDMVNRPIAYYTLEPI